MSNERMMDAAREAVVILKNGVAGESTRPLFFADAIYSLCRAMDILAVRPGMADHVSGLILERDDFELEVKRLRDENTKLKRAKND